MGSKGTVDIRGKSYKLIVQRVAEFRKSHPDWGMHSDVVHHDEDRVIVKVWITDAEGRTRGTGLAEEDRRASRINETSAMENCETSAFGRALASVGFGGDVAYASAEEVVNAMNTQDAQDAQVAKDYKYAIAHGNAVREWLDEVVQMKTAMTVNEDYMAAAGIFLDFDEDVMNALRRAPSKGGVWTTEEVNMLKADGPVGKCISAIKKREHEEGLANPIRNGG